MVFQAVQVLVSLPADLTLVRLLLLHTHRAGIWGRSLRVDNRKCAIRVIVKSLVIVAVLRVGQLSVWTCRNRTYRFMVFETILILVSLLTPNHRTSERLRLVMWEQIRSRVWQAC